MGFFIGLIIGLAVGISAHSIYASHTLTGMGDVMKAIHEKVDVLLHRTPPTPAGTAEKPKSPPVMG